MASSGTYAFAPSIGELVLNAFARIQVRPAQLLAEQVAMARAEANLLLGEWVNRGVNLWTVELVTLPLVPGQATYVLAANTIALLDVYITTPGNPPIDRMIFPVSRSEYASFPDKTTPGFPSTYWFNRLISPELTIWQPPDSQQTYTLKYYRVRQVQDASVPNDETPDIPYRHFDAFAAGLAHRLARLYAPALEDKRKQDAIDAFMFAGGSDVENVQVYVTPQLSGYFR